MLWSRTWFASSMRDVEDDFLGLWLVPWRIRKRLPDADAADIRRLAEEVVRGLVHAGLRVGDLVSGRGFVAWEGTNLVGE